MRALLIDPDGTGSPLTQRVLDELSSAGVEVDVARSSDRAVAAEAASRDGSALFVIGPGLKRPADAAWRLHRERPAAPFLFVTAGDEPGVVERIDSAALVGMQWRVARADADELPRVVSETVRAAEQRQRLRTTLDRVNARLAGAPRQDVSAFRRHSVSDRFLAGILAEVRDGILTAGTDGSVVTLNQSAVAMLGLDAASAVGRRLPDLAPAPWAERVSALLEEAAARPGTTADAELSLPRDGAPPLDVELAVTSVRSETGEPLGIAVVVRDVGERRRLEAERLRLERQHLESQRLESLGLLAGGIAHDFNNILTAILGNAELALSSVDEASDAAARLQTMRSATERASDLCRQMLAYSGQSRLQVDPVHMNEVAGDVLRLLAMTIPSEASVRRDLAADLPRLEGDEAQLRQVVINLLTNAWEALEGAPGTIAVRTRAARAADGREAVELCVSDTGCGMDASTRRRAFEPFFTTRFTGRGLGLAAVEGIVRAHGGTIDVESEPGRGTRVTVVLPAATGSAGAGLDGGRADHGVLVVVDEVSTRQLARHVLEAAGYRVLLSSAGRDGLDDLAAHRDSIDVVLVDLAPSRDRGRRTLLAAIRANAPDASVIVLCDDDRPSVRGPRDRGLEGCAFLRTPLTPAELVARVDACTADSARRRADADA